MKKMITEKRRIPGLSYAFTKDGIELPVLDVTHPLYAAGTDEANLHEMIKGIGKNAAKRAESFNKIPMFIKRYFAKRSFIMAGIMEMSTGNRYVSGLSTMMMKLGPGLIGKGRKKMFDRLASGTIGAIMLRMRVRDISMSLADSIMVSLKNKEEKDLCLINIGGGTASDSLNALIILKASYPEILNDKKIELNILDIDDYGPYFASESAKALTSDGGVLNGIDLVCRYFSYDWRDTAQLRILMNERTGWVRVYSSEGGLFEYGEERHIVNNLSTIREYSEKGTLITGSILKDAGTIDPIMKETLSMTSIKPFLYGPEVLGKLANESGWNIKSINGNNPRYLIFTLSRI